ncbi:MAG: nuclear transport factor 2 family protein [bacterium]
MRSLSPALLAMLFVASATFSQDAKLSRAQREVVETERAFARYCVENGIRAAWLEYFTDDGIIFQPGPINSKEFYSKRPVQPKPPRIILNWEPRYGDVSKGGDLGYNIGPWNLDVRAPEQEPTVHGYYMSVWKRQPGGKWKIALDFGSGRGVPASDDHVFGKPFQQARQYKIKVPPGSSSPAELQRVMDIDRRMKKTSESAGALDSYLALVADDARIMRAAVAPADRESVRSFITAGKDLSLSFDPVGGEVAKSNDLGYTYGSYELQEGGQTKEKGFYAHIFKRSPSGKWQIVVSNTEKGEK